MTVPTLETPRFVCRPLQEGDEEALWPAFCDPETMRYWSRGPFADREAFKSYLFDRAWNGRTWIAEPREGGAPVFRMVAGPKGDEVTEIGYILVPGHHGRGIARECVSAMLTQLFRQEGVHRIWADTDPRNGPSNRLVKSLGFTREAHLREAMKTHIGWCDTWLWGLLADEWPE